MPPDLLAELAQIEHIDGVKQANDDELGPDRRARRSTPATTPRSRAGWTSAERAAILVASHVVGEEMRRMVDEPEQRAEIDASLRDVYDVLFITASPTCVKAALNMLGIEAGGLRLPLVEATEDERAARSARCSSATACCAPPAA